MKLWPFGSKQVQKGGETVNDRAWTRIFDFRPGAWQSDAAYQSTESVLSQSATFACVSLISGDIAKLRPTVQEKTGGIWREAQNQAAEVLRKPNGYQNHIRFKQHWIESKLIHGNTYALKVRSAGRVTGLHVLDPLRVTPLVSDSGDVFYKLSQQRLAGVDTSELTVPAREIIHDRWNCIYHPLIGLPPIYASAVPSRIGLTIQENAKGFFANASSPGGILAAPGSISDQTAIRLKEYWEGNFTGERSGRIAVVGDGLKYEPMRMSNVDSQLLEHLKWSAETVCSTFHVPGYMVGVGPMPTHNNIEALHSMYYSQCLQILIEDMETSLDEGLMVPQGKRVQLDLDGLLRMDSATQMESLARAVGAGILAPDEARAKLGFDKVPGGKYPYLQQQNYSLEALSKRDGSIGTLNPT